MSECADSVVGGVKCGSLGIHRERERDTDRQDVLEEEETA